MPVKTMAYETKDYSDLIGMEGFSEGLLNNHFKLYQGYVSNANKLLEQIAELPQDGADPRFAELNRRLGFEWNGMRLHEYYFESLGGDGKIDKGGPLAKKISEDFGSVDSWQKSFKATGMIRGVGWAGLYLDPNTNRLLNFWIGEHHISHPSGCRLLLVMDVWEHAFMLDYGLNRKDYIEAFSRNINWQAAEQRLSGGSKAWK
ncbi:MAG: Fe-Mn family superoxide dismutase [Nitrospiraceae bacterium]|nr:Fe-Mn family superoxide dismutase [Nitrospiraceae bacterium]